MIISLVGPPAGGKTTLAKALCNKYGAKHLPIDDFRKSEAELLQENFSHSAMNEIEISAWSKYILAIEESIKNNKITVIESTGTSWRMRHVYKVLKERKVIVIRLTAPKDICVERFSSRGKPIFFPYDIAIEDTIDFTIKKTLNLNPDISIDTSLTDPEETANRVVKILDTYL